MPFGDVRCTRVVTAHDDGDIPSWRKGQTTRKTRQLASSIDQHRRHTSLVCRLWWYYGFVKTCRDVGVKTQEVTQSRWISILSVEIFCGQRVVWKRTPRILAVLWSIENLSVVSLRRKAIIRHTSTTNVSPHHHHFIIFFRYDMLGKQPAKASIVSKWWCQKCVPYISRETF